MSHDEPAGCLHPTEPGKECLICGARQSTNLWERNPKHTETVAWICDDERYPYVQGIVTTRPDTLAAWIEGGIKFTPLVRRSTPVSRPLRGGE